MRSRRYRGLVLLISLALVAAACSKPKGKETLGSTTTTTALGEETTTTAVAAGATTTTAKKVTTTKKTTRLRGAAIGAALPSTIGQKLVGYNSADADQARLVGANIYPQSTARGAKDYRGTSGNVIKVGYAYDKNVCGINPTAALVAAGGLVPTPSRYYRGASTTPQDIAADKEEAVQVDQKFFNEHAFDIADFVPHVRAAMGNDPQNQYYGRHIETTMIDGGSSQCPEQQGKAGQQIYDEGYFTSMVDDALEGSGYNIGAKLHSYPASNRPMHFGTLWMSDTLFNQFAPFDWTQFATGTTIVTQLGTWVCARLKGNKAVNSTDPTFQASTRMFGLVHSNAPQVKDYLVGELKDVLKGCGISTGAGTLKEVEYNYSDIAAQQTDARNLVVQLQTNVPPVTSVINLTDLLFPTFEMQQAQQQAYYPEWIGSSFGLQDASPVIRIYDLANCAKDRDGKVGAHCETRGSMGLSQLGVYGGFNYDKADAFNVYHLYHQTAPDGRPCDLSSDAGMDHGDKTGATAKFCKAPSVQATIYYDWLDFIGGLLFAGPDLTPQHVTDGLHAYPITRYGGNGPSSDPRPALVSPAGKYGFVADAVEFKWHPEFQSPQPENKLGWISYPDCERHYISWAPEQLAKDWEKSGPNYNKYCMSTVEAPPNHIGYPPYLDQPQP